MKRSLAIAFVIALSWWLVHLVREDTPEVTEPATTPAAPIEVAAAQTEPPPVEQPPGASPSTPPPPNPAPAPKKPAAGQTSSAPPSVPPPPPGGVPNPIFAEHQKSVGFPGGSRPPRWPFRKLERNLRNKLSDREIDETLHKLRPTNFAPYIHSALPLIPRKPSPAGPVGPGLPPPPQTPAPPAPTAPADPTVLDRLFGRFEGDIRFDQGGKIWQVSWELTGKVVDDKLTGSSAFELTQNGQTVTRTTQSGELSSVKKLADDSISVLLTPTDNYAFQIYYLPEHDAFAGNFYEKNPDHTVSAKGVVRLARKAAVSPSRPR